MGTRADYYVCTGDGPEGLEWIGSTAYDGHPEWFGRFAPGARARTESGFRRAVAKRCRAEDGTTPDMGWPWPWDDSTTTDYAYIFNGHRVFFSNFGRRLLTLDEVINGADDGDEKLKDFFPDMSAKRAIAAPGSNRSGILVVGDMS